MIVTSKNLKGSIGGGRLEFEATGTAREMLAKATDTSKTLAYGLGPALNQCCGGAVTVLFELLSAENSTWLEDLHVHQESTRATLLLTAIDRGSVSKWTFSDVESIPKEIPPEIIAGIEASQEDEAVCILVGKSGDDRYMLERIEHRALDLYLFGAGHVAQAVVIELARQPVFIHWIDSRASQFPALLPGNVTQKVSQNPASEVKEASAGTIFLVMTHSHSLDEDICLNVLQRNDAAWLGLIGSVSKRKRFEHRLKKRGISKSELDLLKCPVGMAGIVGKRPATIAVSIAAQLLQEVIPEHWR
ncbi:MAG: xanthine dehydrogenase accessory factor [Rhodothermales bacterium]|jgi:xanthine dehydrogenase accessory factor